MGMAAGRGGGGTLRRFLGKRVLVSFKNYSIRLDLKNYIDTMIYFLLMFCSLSTFVFSLYSMISFLLFIYLFIYLKEELKTPLKQVTS